MSLAQCPACDHTLPLRRSEGGVPCEFVGCPTCKALLLSGDSPRIPLLTRTPAGKSSQFITLSELFKERYEILRLLGRGSSGMVVQARQADGRQVAIKFLTQSEDPESKARFLREGSVATTLRHPRIVATEEVGEVSGHLYMVCELMSGGTLRDRLASVGRMSEPEVREVMAGCLEGLAACHERGIVHRDLKPENILFDGEGRAKIADLGLAKPCSDDAQITRDGTILGTPTYMSPEQVRGDPLTAASDVYSTGVILFELLTGLPPFDAPSSLEVMDQHLRMPPPSLAQFQLPVTDDLVQIIDGCLRKSTAERPRSAAEVTDYLRGSTPVPAATTDTGPGTVKIRVPGVPGPLPGPRPAPPAPPAARIPPPEHGPGTARIERVSASREAIPAIRVPTTEATESRSALPRGQGPSTMIRAIQPMRAVPVPGVQRRIDEPEQRTVRLEALGQLSHDLTSAGKRHGLLLAGGLLFFVLMMLILRWEPPATIGPQEKAVAGPTGDPWKPESVRREFQRAVRQHHALRHRVPLGVHIDLETIVTRITPRLIFLRAPVAEFVIPPRPGTRPAVGAKYQLRGRIIGQGPGATILVKEDPP